MLGINLRPELKKDLHILHIFIHENKDKGTYGFHNEKIAMVHGSWSIPMDFPWEMFGCFSPWIFPTFPRLPTRLVLGATNFLGFFRFRIRCTATWSFTGTTTACDKSRR
jgi:hypothetical protein